MPNRRSLLAASATQAGGGLPPRTAGSLFAWGANNNYRLGTGNTTYFSSPVQVGGSWTSVMSNTGNSSSGVKADGTLWTWGDGSNGQHGKGSPTGTFNSPSQVGSGTGWNSVWDGYQCKFAIRSNGTLWSWGSNTSTYGQLGLGDLANRSSPSQVGSATNWARVINKLGSTFAVTSTGNLFAWGRNQYGKLGVGDSVNRSSPVQVGGLWAYACSSSYVSIGVKQDGTLWTWGRNYFGLFGDGTVSPSTFKSSPAQVGSGTTWVSAAIGRFGALAIRSDGTLWSWGRNRNGSLGQNDLTDRSSPTQVGTGNTWASVFHDGGRTLAVKTNGTLWAWGMNTQGNCGLGDQIHRSSPVQIGSGTTWITSPVFTGSGGNYVSFWIKS